MTDLPPEGQSGDLPEMDCADFVELVTDYLEGTLADPDRRRFEQHLAECPYCEQYLEQFRVVIAELGALAAEHLSEGARADLLGAFRGWSSGRDRSP